MVPMKRWSIVIATLMLAGTWGILESFTHDEDVLFKKPFKQFPRTLSDRWKGQDLTLDEEALQTLQLSDYLMRVYTPTQQSGASPDREVKHETLLSGSKGRLQYGPIWLYIGYYQSQRTGATYHSPKNCLPGAGWQFIDSEYVSVSLPQTTSVTINKVLIQKGLDQQVILYWYQDRGRTVASEYWAKAYMIWDAMTINRTDGSLVRIAIPVIKSPEEAYLQGLQFLQDVWPSLVEYLPANAASSI